MHRTLNPLEKRVISPKATASPQGYGAAVNIPSEIHIITQHAGLKTFMFRLLYIFFKNIR